MFRAGRTTPTRRCEPSTSPSSTPPRSPAGRLTPPLQPATSREETRPIADYLKADFVKCITSSAFGKMLMAGGDAKRHLQDVRRGTGRVHRGRRCRAARRVVHHVLSTGSSPGHCCSTRGVIYTGTAAPTRCVGSVRVVTDISQHVEGVSSSGVTRRGTRKVLKLMTTHRRSPSPRSSPTNCRHSPSSASSLKATGAADEQAHQSCCEGRRGRSDRVDHRHRHRASPVASRRPCSPVVNGRW